ncbi:hypothetical protein OJAV_G00118700 [Oryzias javanicus]|uniref:Uncharacterized protein n=1 Tax=Oryzias javanicus TaxID=123683 RepID=A0A3S2MS66_ORYJA|nr:hypothetical protein OJAV_G00118700 [Oryzias javanicus]
MRASYFGWHQTALQRSSRITAEEFSKITLKKHSGDKLTERSSDSSVSQKIWSNKPLRCSVPDVVLPPVTEFTEPNTEEQKTFAVKKKKKRKTRTLICDELRVT